MKKQVFNNDLYEGNTGKVMLELSKTYKGDSRFKLDERFKDDLDVDKLPQKFKQIAEKGVIQSLKKKKIKKDKPLIIQRFEPGTVAAQAIVKKAQGKKKYQQGLRRHQQKQKKKLQIQSGINRLKKAEQLVNQTNSNPENQDHSTPKFKKTVHGNLKQAFKQTQFKLFG